MSPKVNPCVTLKPQWRSTRHPGDSGRTRCTGGEEEASTGRLKGAEFKHKCLSSGAERVCTSQSFPLADQSLWYQTVMEGMSTALTSNPTCEGITVEHWPPGSTALMEILWMVFHFIETLSLTGRLWEPDVLYGQSGSITWEWKSAGMLFSGTGTNMLVKFYSKQRRILT